MKTCRSVCASPLPSFILMRTREGHVWDTFSNAISTLDWDFFYLTAGLVVASPVPQAYSYCQLQFKILEMLKLTEQLGAIKI